MSYRCLRLGGHQLYLVVDGHIPGIRSLGGLGKYRRLSAVELRSASWVSLRGPSDLLLNFSVHLHNVSDKRILCPAILCSQLVKERADIIGAKLDTFSKEQCLVYACLRPSRLSSFLRN